MRVKHNPIIGYHIVDKSYCVLGPPGTMIDPAFASKESARRAAKRYGLEKKVHLIGALYLGGVLGVVFADGRTRAWEISTWMGRAPNDWLKPVSAMALLSTRPPSRGSIWQSLRQSTVVAKY